MTTLNYLKDLTAPQTRDLSDSQMSSLEAKLVKALTGPGPAGLGLQVVVGAWNGQSAPIAEARKIHAERQGKKIFPLVVALEDARGNVWLMGPSGDTSPVGPVYLPAI